MEAAVGLVLFICAAVENKQAKTVRTVSDVGCQDSGPSVSLPSRGNS